LRENAVLLKYIIGAGPQTAPYGSGASGLATGARGSAAGRETRRAGIAGFAVARRVPVRRAQGRLRPAARDNSVTGLACRDNGDGRAVLARIRVLYRAVEFGGHETMAVK